MGELTPVAAASRTLTPGSYHPAERRPQLAKVVPPIGGWDFVGGDFALSADSCSGVTR